MSQMHEGYSRSKLEVPVSMLAFHPNQMSAEMSCLQRQPSMCISGHKMCSPGSAGRLPRLRDPAQPRAPESNPEAGATPARSL